MHKKPNETTPEFLKRQQDRLTVVKAKKVGSGNRKKNPKARRPRGKLGVYIPWVLLNLGEFQSKIKSQQIINNGLFRRAQVARRKGGYHVFEKLNRGKK